MFLFNCHPRISYRFALHLGTKSMLHLLDDYSLELAAHKKSNIIANTSRPNISTFAQHSEIFLFLSKQISSLEFFTYLHNCCYNLSDILSNILDMSAGQTHFLTHENVGYGFTQVSSIMRVQIMRSLKL